MIYDNLRYQGLILHCNIYLHFVWVKMGLESDFAKPFHAPSSNLLVPLAKVEACVLASEALNSLQPTSCCFQR